MAVNTTSSSSLPMNSNKMKTQDETLESMNGNITTTRRSNSRTSGRKSSTLKQNESCDHTHPIRHEHCHQQLHHHSSSSSSSYRNHPNNGSRVLTCAAALAAACSIGQSVTAATPSSSPSAAPTAPTSSLSFGLAEVSPPSCSSYPSLYSQNGSGVDGGDCAPSSSSFAVAVTERGRESMGTSEPLVFDTESSIRFVPDDDRWDSLHCHTHRDPSFLRQLQPSHCHSQTVLSLLRGGGDDKSNHNHKPNKHSNHHDITKSILRETNYYTILGLSSSSSSTLTQTQITKAYRRRCVLTHPDKTPDGDRRAFDKVAEAYDVLGDEEKRSRYDRFGLEGVNNPATMGAAASAMGGMGGMGGMGDLQDQILRSFFGQRHHSPFFSSSSSSSSSSSPFSRHRRAPPPRNHNVQYTLKVSLQDLYNGSTHPLHLSRSKRTIDVSVPRGTISGQTIRLSGEIDHVADATPGDLLLTVEQVPHGVFTRKGHDLAMECVISFKESVCGFRRGMNHLDGRLVWFCSPEVDVANKNSGRSSSSSSSNSNGNENVARRRVPMLISTGDIHVLKGEGMPKRGSTNAASSMEDDIRHKDEDEETYLQRRCQRYGDLYVQYKVELPQQMDVKNLSDDERRQLGVLLDKLEGKSSLSDDTVTAGTTTATTTTTNRRSSSSSSKNTTKADTEPEADQQRGDDDLRSLTPASALDFGQVSGTIDPNDDVHDGEEHLHHHHDNDDEAWEGFDRATAGRRRTGQTRFFSNLGGSASSPFSGAFGGAGFGGDDDGEVQCQQM